MACCVVVTRERAVMRRIGANVGRFVFMGLAWRVKDNRRDEVAYYICNHIGTAYTVPLAVVSVFTTVPWIEQLNTIRYP